ncbi:hypothetical protein [Massilia sp. PWRC2]|uniref:hypothetical protein n=1 Tax=Massilia sp. PWRC2 TaxID=2804626 RepID=UPI003CE6DDFB
MNKRVSDSSTLARKLAGAALLARRVDGDYLVLSDATLCAAIDGSCPLRSAEAQALAGSPLTLRRLRLLADGMRATPWSASAGMLRAAASADSSMAVLETDDGHWALHFVLQDGQWQLVLKLDAAAPFAARLLAGDGAPFIEVRDGAGGLLLQGRLDGDGECEQAWPCALAPALHFQQHGARFTVTPVTLVAPAGPAR